MDRPQIAFSNSNDSNRRKRSRSPIRPISPIRFTQYDEIDAKLNQIPKVQRSAINTKTKQNYQPTAIINVPKASPLDKKPKLEYNDDDGLVITISNDKFKYPDRDNPQFEVQVNLDSESTKDGETSNDSILSVKQPIKPTMRLPIKPLTPTTSQTYQKQITPICNEPKFDYTTLSPFKAQNYEISVSNGNEPSSKSSSSTTVYTDPASSSYNYQLNDYNNNNSQYKPQYDDARHDARSTSTDRHDKSLKDRSNYSSYGESGHNDQRGKRYSRQSSTSSHTNITIASNNSENWHQYNKPPPQPPANQYHVFPRRSNSIEKYSGTCTPVLDFTSNYEHSNYKSHSSSNQTSLGLEAPPRSYNSIPSEYSCRNDGFNSLVDKPNQSNYNRSGSDHFMHNTRDRNSYTNERYTDKRASNDRPLGSRSNSTNSGNYRNDRYATVNDKPLHYVYNDRHDGRSTGGSFYSKNSSYDRNHYRNNRYANMNDKHDKPIGGHDNGTHDRNNSNSGANSRNSNKFNKKESVTQNNDIEYWDDEPTQTVSSNGSSFSSKSSNRLSDSFAQPIVESHHLDNSSISNSASSSITEIANYENDVDYRLMNILNSGLSEIAKSAKSSLVMSNEPPEPQIHSQVTNLLSETPTRQQVLSSTAFASINSTPQIDSDLIIDETRTDEMHNDTDYIKLQQLKDTVIEKKYLLKFYEVHLARLKQQRIKSQFNVTTTTLENYSKKDSLYEFTKKLQENFGENKLAHEKNLQNLNNEIKIKLKLNLNDCTSSTDEQDRQKHEVYICKECDCKFAKLNAYLQHLFSFEHLHKFNFKTSCNYLNDVQDQQNMDFIMENDDNHKKNTAIKGAEFVFPCRAYYCSLCDELCANDGLMELHLQSLPHSQKYQELMKQ